MATSFKDVAQLLNSPEYPNSVQWADDGTLAIAEGSCIGILHPGSLNGSQAFAAVDGFAQDTVIAAPGKPQGSSIHFDVALSLRVLLSSVKESAAAAGGGKGGSKAPKEGANQIRRPLASAKAISWSPCGAATSGSCLIATVTNDHRITIFGPDSKLDPEWHPLFVIHEHLLNYLTETQWAAIDAVTLRESGVSIGSQQRGSGGNTGARSRDRRGAGEDTEDDDEDKTDDDEDMLRLRGGAGGGTSDEGEDSPSDEEKEEKQAGKKKKKGSTGSKKTAVGDAGGGGGRGRGRPSSAAGQPAAPAPVPFAGGNRRKAAAPRVAPAGDATDQGDPSSANAGAVSALAAQAVLAGIPHVEFRNDRLPKLEIADTAAKRFFELRRQQEPSSLPIYEKSNTHLKGVDKNNLEQVSEEYYTVYKDKITELGMDKKAFFKECRIALPRCWNRRRNVFIEGFEESIGGGFGPGGVVQESSQEDSDSEATEDEDLGEEGEEGRRKLRKRRSAKTAAAKAAGGGTGEDDSAFPGGEGGREQEEGAQAAAAAAGAKPQVAKRKRGAAAAPEPVFERDPFEIPTIDEETGSGSSFTWRDLPPVDNSNRTTLKLTLVEGAVKRFLRLRAGEPAELLPIYPNQKAYTKGVDAWIVDRVMKEYMHHHAPAMTALQFDTKKFTTLVNARLRQVWERSSNTFLEAGYDINSDNGLEHPAGSGEDGSLGPVPIHDKYDPYVQKRSKIASASATVGGGGGGASGIAAAAAVSRAADGAAAKTTDTKKRAGRPKVGFGYGKDSLGGTQWWGGNEINSDVYERRLLSISAISVAWSPAVVTSGTENATFSPHSSSSSCSILAVGSKEGSIWLWRCQHPAVPAVPGSVEVESARLKLRMELIGRLPGNLSWVNTMKWISIPIENPNSSSPTTAAAAASGSSAGAGCAGAVLVLVVGTSDGAVTLWGSDASALASYSPSFSLSTSPSPLEEQLPMEKWNTILHPDLIQVISIDAALRYSTNADGTLNNGAGGANSPGFNMNNPSTSKTAAAATAAASTAGAVATQLVVAIGKSAGVVSAWTSTDFSFINEKHTTKSRTSSKKDKFSAPCTRAVMIEKLKRALQQNGQLMKIPEASGLGSSSVTGVGLGAGGEMVVACTREGVLESWSLPRTSSGSSGGGGVLAMQLRSTPVACNPRKQKESGFGSFGVAVSPGGLFVAVPKNQLPAGTEYVKQLQVWQRLALGLLHIHRIAGPGAELDGFSAATRVCKSWAAQQLPPAALWDAVTLGRMQDGLASAVAETLETEFLEIQQSVTSKITPEKLVPSDIPNYAWRLLKAAVTLRRSAAAAAVAAAKNEHTLEIPHQEVLDRDQMLLLQRQLEKLLRGSGSGSGSATSEQQQQQQQLSRLLAADCVVANAKHNDLMLGLLPLAVKAYHKSGETPPGEANAFAIPSRDGGALLDHRPVAMTGGGAAAALTTIFHEEGQAVVLHRCPATLEVSLGSGKWVCRGCQRAYNELPLKSQNTINDDKGVGGSGEIKNVAPPDCVMCGGLLGPYCPDFLLVPPCI